MTLVLSRDSMAAGRAAIVVAMVVLVGVAGLGAYVLFGQHTTTEATSAGVTTTRCVPIGGTDVARSQLESVQFGAVEEYNLPEPSRWSNAITTAVDGSVWFGEEALPGVGHLFSNGTLVEYSWPTAGRTTADECGYRTGIWGIKAWNGMVWATDGDEDAIVGINPQDGRAIVVNLTRETSEPYTLAVAPDGSLWFTTLSDSAQLGRLAPDLSVAVYPVNGLNGEVPLQVQFVNSSYAYFVALNPFKPPYGHLYAFDPETVGATIDPVQVGGTFQIVEPTSVSASGDRVWITQHGASSITSYDTLSGMWTTFPTTTDNFTYTTLPYFVEASGDSVWFNEHYANKIALLNSSAGTLTEYSEANPPIENASLIQNDLTIARGDGGLWFTSTTGNYIGFVNGSYENPFSLLLDGANSASLSLAQTMTLELHVEGVWSRPLQVGESDSENYSSIPKFIQITPSEQTVPVGSGPAQIQVNVTARPGLAPGRYTLGVSVSDGLVTQTVYFFLTVS